MNVENQFAIGSEVNFWLGDLSIRGTITGILIRSFGYWLYEVSWFHEGDVRQQWIHENFVEKA